MNNINNPKKPEDGLEEPLIITDGLSMPLEGKGDSEGITADPAAFNIFDFKPSMDGVEEGRPDDELMWKIKKVLPYTEFKVVKNVKSKKWMTKKNTAPTMS